MSNIEIVIGLLFVIIVLAAVTRCLKIPYPVVFTVGGVLLSLIPALPHIVLTPKLVFLLFVPPILFYSAYYTSWRDFRANIRPISLLAFLLVAVTTFGVAAVTKWLVPDMPWAAACVLGAIISPPDAISATSIMHTLKIPRRIITVIEGESLINDASGLILYKFAVAVVMTGSFSLIDASFNFVVMSVGGVMLGLLLGWLTVRIMQAVDDVTISIAISLLAPFILYLIAEKLFVSGILTVVTAGLVVGWYAPKIFTPQRRLRGAAFWDTFIFLITGTVFVLIGLQLPSILANLGKWSYLQLAYFTSMIVLACIVIRFVWVFIFAYGVRAMFPKIRQRDPYPGWRNVVIISWAGMRGLVSLGAALALPFVIANGDAFPERNLIIFLAFSSIVGMLVFQGLTLPLLIKWLALKDDIAVLHEEHLARAQIGKAMFDAVEILKEKQTFSQRALEIAKRECLLYTVSATIAEDPNHETQDCIDEIRKIQCNMISIGRDKLIELRNSGLISDEILRIIQTEFDLEETRLYKN